MILSRHCQYNGLTFGIAGKQKQRREVPRRCMEGKLTGA
jgi:hypothetical protein